MRAKLMKFPIPFSSLYSLIQGVRGESSIYSSGFITFHPNDNSSFVREGPLTIQNNTPLYFRQCVSVTPHYFVSTDKPCKRLYVSTEIWEQKIYRPRMIKEVLQVEEIARNDYNLLVHIEKIGDTPPLRKQLRNTLFHDKFYRLTTVEVNNHHICTL